MGQAFISNDYQQHNLKQQLGFFMSDKENKDIKSDAINDDDVMISTSISDLEKMLESVEARRQAHRLQI
ncbi:hypothetical protein BSPWISOXPB_8771 [uncultured Gammaproteobacteria bacterium]|nr:hypothetical protein BSPWISOXPB_8771 [uncultured Gammaproteobacteria bacterium]